MLTKGVEKALFMWYNQGMEISFCEKMTNDENLKYILEEQAHAKALLEKCYVALGRYSLYCRENNEDVSPSVIFAENIYKARKAVLEDNRRKKLKLLKRLQGQPEGSVDLSKVRASLERYKIKDNEEFVDDLIDILEEEKHQDAINKFGSRLIIECFVNFVIDQEKLSKFDVGFYQNLLYLIRTKNERQLDPEEKA